MVNPWMQENHASYPLEISSRDVKFGVFFPLTICISFLGLL